MPPLFHQSYRKPVLGEWTEGGFVVHLTSEHRSVALCGAAHENKISKLPVTCRNCTKRLGDAG